MKELEKTKHISIASVVFILVIIIGLLAYKRPKHLYSENTKSTLENITNNNYFVSLEDLNSDNTVLVDVRNQFEFQKGHLENAINIYTPELFSDNNFTLLNDLKNEAKIIILYGTNTNDVTVPFLLLKQLGFTNIKMATIKNSYYQNQLITVNDTIEKPVANIKAFIDESVKNSNQGNEQTIVKDKTPPKKVITIKKKKKTQAEGGC